MCNNIIFTNNNRLNFEIFRQKFMTNILNILQIRHIKYINALLICNHKAIFINIKAFKWKVGKKFRVVKFFSIKLNLILDIEVVFISTWEVEFGIVKRTHLVKNKQVVLKKVAFFHYLDLRNWYWNLIPE